MSVKNTKAIKSNVAKTTGKTSLLNRKLKFNWKIVVVIGVILVAALGYLYVRLSKAGTVAHQTWYTNSFQAFGTSSTIDNSVQAGSFPATAWYGGNGGFRIPHTNLGAGRYCFFDADLQRGGGNPVTTLKLYGVNGQTKTVVSSAIDAQCISATADVASYQSREFEYSVTGGMGGVGSVTFIPAATNDGKGTFWLPSQMSLYQAGMYGSLKTPWAGALPVYESQTVAPAGTAASPGGDYLYVSLNTDSTTAAEYCIEGYAADGTQFAMDASNKGPRDVQYEAIPNLRFKRCKTLTPTNGTSKVNIFMTSSYDTQNPNKIWISNAYRNPAPVPGSKAKS